VLAFQAVVVVMPILDDRWAFRKGAPQGCASGVPEPEHDGMPHRETCRCLRQSGRQAVQVMWCVYEGGLP